MRTTKLDKFHAFETWRKALPKKRPGIARQQVGDGVKKDIEAQCHNADGCWIRSKDLTLDEIELLREWLRLLGYVKLPH